MTSLSASDIASRFACTLARGKGSDVTQVFEGVATLQHASASHISFLANERYLSEALSSRAGAILCTAKNAELLEGKTNSALFICAEPYVVFARLAQHFYKPQHPFRGISEHAVIDSSAKIDDSATVFPFAFVGPGAVIGARSVVYSGCFVGAAAHVGEECILYPNVVVREGSILGDRCILNPGAVIGGDGFGFAPTSGENVKIPQMGAVEIASDVEVGSNASIDRGTMANTVIGKQTKIDSLVQIGHNARIGESCFLAGQAGIAGSTILGNRVILAGQVGVAGHLQIADDVTVLAQGGVSKSLLKKGLYNGSPARPNMEYLRQMAVLSHLSKSKNKD